MAADNSFDVISKVDVQEVRNAMHQAIKEVRTRFDLKDSHSEIKLLEGNLLAHAGAGSGFDFAVFEGLQRYPALNELLLQDFGHRLELVLV